MSDIKSQELRWKFGFDNAFGVKSVGASGGLVLYWNNYSDVSVKSFSSTHIDVMISNNLSGQGVWRFTGFYGQPTRSARYRSWELMRYLRREYDEPWLCAGDFNETLCAFEQFGGNDREEWKMEGFREAVDCCRMTDLGFSGLPYTWDNRKQGRANIKVRLDRGLGDDRFMELFENTSVHHVQTTESDHCALLIKVGRSDWLGGSNSKRPFRFENMWTRHERYPEVIRKSWRTGNTDLGQIHRSLGILKSSLTQRSREEFGSVKKQLMSLREKLERIREGSLRTGPSREEKDVMNRISELLAREETMVKQRSRVLWLAEGDRNTAYFHAKARERSRRNKIVSIRKDDGSYASAQGELELLATDFYTSLFRAQDHTNPEVVTKFVPHKVTYEMNERLCAPFTDVEIETALFMMHPNKSPGPDGFTDSISNIGIY
jgi:hypothetical protein